MIASWGTLSYGLAMAFQFLSDEWFQEVDKLIAAAGDLQIPPAMRAVEVNVTITSPAGSTDLFMKDGLFTRGHQASAPTRLTIASDLARKIFVDGDPPRECRRSSRARCRSRATSRSWSRCRPSSRASRRRP